MVIALREWLAHRKHHVTDPLCGRCAVVDRDKRQAEIEVMVDCVARAFDHADCKCWCHVEDES